ncbi:uba ts-n domain-containing protein [Colletotrichum truncatum]|uniref:Uba ts-n domain-containing protein n=1 Tax=Colletotrichum truncatum TaxID=5467 RepID=A0ACC3ZH49_COLTU|nr:uba ts-n domain-containing protein [Colletotrichum truncatum]KAF6790583.1 uba ts-n domain-containing protein [Colletotrichum truncatum]
MDDLSGLNWSSSASKPGNKPPPMNPSGANYFGSMPQSNSTPSPFPSGRNTPLSAQGSGSVAGKPPAAKPAADSFSNLMNFAGAPKSTANLSLREQQQRLEAEKWKKEEERRKQAQAQFGGGFLDSLGSGNVSRTASPSVLSPGSSTGKKASDDDDLFAAFKSETKVDNASHYPPPPQKGPSPAHTPALDLTNPSAWNKPTSSTNNGGFGDDDDPFGLNQMKPKSSSPAPPQPTIDDDDFLGDLGRPVEEVRRKQPTPQPKQPEPGKPIEALESSSDDEQPAPRGEMAEFDKAVAQLVDYGFTPENARRGLTESGAGLNVQAAANWLLDDAHRQAKAKAQGKDPASASRRGREDGRHDGQRRADTRSPAGGEADFSKTAAAMGNSLFKTANSLWKTSKKQVQQAVADFNQEGGDPNQPKWMRTAQQDRMHAPEKRRPEATDEAMMLESGGPPPRRAGQSSQSPRPDAPRRTASPRDFPSASSAPPSGRGTPVPRWQQQAGPAVPDSRTRASKLAMTDDSGASYVSPHRRKKATPQPEEAPPKQEEPDLLFNSQAPKPSQSLPQRPAQSSRPAQPSQPSQPAQPARRPSPPAPRPAPRPARQIPSITPAAIQQSTKHRLEGTAHFKRGDYAAAQSSYSSSLSSVPESHPLAIVILTNRALTALKTGEPKQAVEDADAALKIIGPAGGQGEHVTVVGDNGGDEKRDMRDLYGKALSRKAEALEQMERWGDAHAVWSTCVKNGVGGSTAISGRQRCQNALAPKPKPKPRPAAPARPRAAAAPAKSSEAVERLRKQNLASAAEDDEKFALSEKVDAKIAAWRDGKRDNLRALIGSLDQVLWEGSGWKKVGLHELVMANKVKINYMKAIAKCHPDKLPQDASTEVRLIAATVFATLNESWDKFKAENGL